MRPLDTGLSGARGALGGRAEAAPGARQARKAAPTPAVAAAPLRAAASTAAPLHARVEHGSRHSSRRAVTPRPSHSDRTTRGERRVSYAPAHVFRARLGTTDPADLRRSRLPRRP